MFVKQISVFLENLPGTLRALTELLGKGGVDLLALSVADTQSFGIVRIIIHSDQIDSAMSILREGQYIARTDGVICAVVPDRPLGLAELLAIIEDAGLSVEYMYSSYRAGSTGSAYMILRLSDPEKAAQIFTEKNVMILRQEDVDKL